MEIKGILHYLNYFVIIILFGLILFSCDKTQVNKYELMLEIEPVESGLVHGSGFYKVGEKVPITANANDGWIFFRWSGNYALIDNYNSSNAVITMPSSDFSLTAIFIVADGTKGTVKDIDGNIYSTVWIGGREWMAENLRVKRYNNGSEIPQIWGWSSRNYYDYYAVYPHREIDGLNSEQDVLNVYGALYNWNVIEDNREVCPQGWRVPSNDEWDSMRKHLVNYYNYPSNRFGKKLKSCRQVSSPHGGDCSTNIHPRWDFDDTHYGIDIFGFSLLPGGRRHSSGHFSHLGYSGNWWTTTYAINMPGTPFIRSTFKYSDGIIVSTAGQTTGLSIRCIKEKI
jgi:uncharacterized protein (TIGR02145 family)